MTEALNRDERFSAIPALEIGSVRFEVSPEVDIVFIYESVHKDEPEMQVALEPDEATALRDWLNQVLK